MKETMGWCVNIMAAYHVLGTKLVMCNYMCVYFLPLLLSLFICNDRSGSLGPSDCCSLHILAPYLNMDGI
jgi:hypothetical protein